VLIALNVGENKQVAPIPEQGEVRLSTYLDHRDERMDAILPLRGAEGVILLSS
jgi:hypothetical protein